SSIRTTSFRYFIKTCIITYIVLPFSHTKGPPTSFYYLSLLK
ncbi:hypothetical protein CCUS01_15532, partial [Colletotrichum cuscutae]